MKSMDVTLNKTFSESISTRSAIENVFSFDKSNVNQVRIDFTGIRLISSSVAHQFILERRKLEKEKIDVIFEKVDPNVQKMLDISRTSRKNIFNIQNVEHHKVNSSRELDRFLLRC